MRLALVNGALSPARCGVGDYVSCLSRELARKHEVAVFRCFEAVSHWRADWAIVQYNPFSFGPRGFSPLRIPRLLRRTRLAVMFHETYTDGTRLRDSILRLWQIPRARTLARAAEAVFVSCEAYRREVGVSDPGRVTRLPVGSSIPLSTLTASEAKARMGFSNGTLVLGTFGTAHPSRRFDWMAAVLRTLRSEGRDAVFLHVGPETERVRRHFPAFFRATGPLDAPEVGHALRSMDVFLCPFSDGISARRSSVMAALQHRLPVLTTRGPRTDALFQAAVHLSGAASGSAFAREAAELLQSPEKLEAIAARGHDLFLRVFDWPRIAETLASVLA